MYFTNGAARSFETMMTAVPNFGVRGKGRVILNQFHYTSQTVDCALCTEHHQKKCGLDRCPYLVEKIEAGEVSYKSLVEDGEFNHHGYVSYQGFVSMEEVLEGVPSARLEQGMGGMS